MTSVFDEFQESLTPEEIQHRFKKIMGRAMTPEEKIAFFLPLEPTDPNPENA